MPRPENGADLGFHRRAAGQSEGASRSFPSKDRLQIVDHTLVRSNDDRRQRVRRAEFAGQGEILSHRVVGNEQPFVVLAGIARVLRFLPHLADDRVRQAVQCDSAADGVSIGEEQPAGGGPDDHDPPGLVIVQLGHRTALTHLDRANDLVDRPHTAHLQRARVERALHAHRAPHQLRADVLEQSGLLLERQNIADRQSYDAAGPLAARLHARAAVSDDDDVLAQLPEDVQVAPLKPFAHSRQDHDGDHAPHDPEHRQEAPEFVGPKVLDGLEKCFAHLATSAG